MAGNFKEIDLGWGKIVKELKELNGSFVKVGLPVGVEVAPVKGSGSGHKPITVSSELIKIAAVQEFGTKRAGKNKNVRIPARAAMRQAFDENQKSINNFKIRIRTGIYNGSLTAHRGLGLLGEFAVSKVKRQITTLKSPANAASTIAKKKSSNPLIDRGQYRNSITFVRGSR